MEAGKNQISSLESALKAAKETKVQTEIDLKEHQTSRSEAKEAMAQATALREKEAAAFAKVKADCETNLSSLGKAIAVINKGVMGSFLQSRAAETLRGYFMEKANVNDAEREEILAFLSGGQSQGYVPQSGDITGILKQMDDQIAADLKDATDTENSAIQTYEELMAAKTKEVNTLTGQIEAEMTRIGDLGVEISTMSIDLEDTKEALGEDTKYLAELGASCETKTKEWEEIKKTRAEELLALAETIKVLNDDDALELFKKTVPSASSSFAQVVLSTAAVKDKALRIIRAAKRKSSRQAGPELDLVELALRGKAAGFAKVITMIEEMIANLKTEQSDDDLKKEYCDTALDQSEDKKKVLELSAKDSETSIDDLTGSIAMLKEEIEALEDGIKKLDKSVAEATDLRKEEHEEYTEMMSSDATAKEVLVWAKNRLNKFYNPKLYKAPPKRDLTAEEGITVSMGGALAPTNAPGGIAGTGIGLVQLVAHHQKGHRAAPPPPPETFGAYAKKTEESGGVIAMIDLIIKELDKEMQEADVEEKDAQKDYEATMASAAAKRAEDSKSLTEKTAAKAAAEEALEAEKDTLKATTKQLLQTAEFISSLHGECDWLLKYFDVRKSARAEEMDALSNAKAVLSGADYSFMQKGESGSRSKGLFLAPDRH
jgi:chromosome segregation ATPase